MCPSGQASRGESAGGGQRKTVWIKSVGRCFADRLSEDEGESSLFTFVVYPGINGRNSSYDTILGNWAEVPQFKTLEV